jgi:dihydrofolate reductase/thymidylate synthase
VVEGGGRPELVSDDLEGCIVHVAGSGDEGLPGRDTYVVSRSLSQDDHLKVTVYKSLQICLVNMMRVTQTCYDKVFIIGGKKLFDEALTNFLPYCDAVYLARAKTSSASDVYFPRLDRILPAHILQPPSSGPSTDDPRTRNGSVEFSTADYTLHIYRLAGHFPHPEQQYLSMLRSVVEDRRAGRFDGAATYVRSSNALAATGPLHFDMSLDSLPAITSRHLDVEQVRSWVVSALQGGTPGASACELMLARLVGRWPTDAMGLLLGEQRQVSIDLRGVDELEDRIPRVVHIHADDKTHMSLYAAYIECEVMVDLPEQLLALALFAHCVASLARLKCAALTASIYSCVMDERNLAAARAMLLCDPKPWCKVQMKNLGSVHELEHFALANVYVRGYDSWKTHAVHCARKVNHIRETPDPSR